MLMDKVKKILAKFGRDKGGQVIVITALLLPVLFTTGGLALDYSRISSTKSALNNSLDAAVLAVGKDIAQGVGNGADHEKLFRDFFMANLAGQGIDPDNVTLTAFDADERTGKVEAEVNLSLDMTFMQIAGFETVDVGAESSAIFDVDPVEIAIMLDTTGSMQGQKLADLKAAAASMVDSLLPRGQKTRGVRIALVPYAASVNAGSVRNAVIADVSDDVARRRAIDKGAISAADKHGANNSCVTERGGFYEATDADPGTAPLGSDKRTEIPGLTCPSADVTPLTNNRGKLLTTINDLTAEGATAGHLGVAWSYYTLSEKWRNVVWQGNARPDTYDSETRKIAVLMTDGEFNSFYTDTTNAAAPDDPYTVVNLNNVERSSGLAEDLCTDMKAPKANGAGFEVYSVAFQAPASAQETLRACATPDQPGQQYYFSAESGEELRAAFEEIAASIGRLRVSR